jgi:hypothetical protein
MEPQARAGPRQPPHCACSSGKRGDSPPQLPCIFRAAAAASQNGPYNHESRVEPPCGSPRRLAATAGQEQAFLAWAVAPARQLARAKPTATSPAVRGARDARLATPAGPACVYPPARSTDRWNPPAGPRRSNRTDTAHLITGCALTRAHAEMSKLATRISMHVSEY